MAQKFEGMKGDGETHPFLSPNDEFADYETWDQGNLNLSVPKNAGWFREWILHRFGV